MDIRQQYIKEAMEGKYFTLSNGNKVKVLQYNTQKDVLVLQENGTTRKCYKQQLIDAPTAPFKSELAIGKEFSLKNGDTVKVIAWRNKNDIDVQFSDGSIRTSVTDAALLGGIISHPAHACLMGQKAINKRLHQRMQNHDGLWCEIVAYRSSTDIDVLFEDGTLLTHQRYYDFQHAHLFPHGYQVKSNKKQERNGLTNINCNGLSMQVLNYKNNKEVEVLFEDGYQCVTRFSKFETGQVPHPTNRKNHTSFPEMAVFYYLQPHGFLKYPKGYLNKYDIRWKRMELDAFNETQKYAVEYDGEYAHEKSEAQQRDILKQELCDKEGIRLIKIREEGLPMHTNTNVIVRHRKQDLLELNDIIKQILEDYNQYVGENTPIDVDIMRDRHAIIQMFTQSSQKLSDRIGTTVRATNGMLMTITGYANHKQMTVTFEDGAVVDGIEYRWFMKGIVAHPKDKSDGRVGQSRISKWGEKMTIIEWKDAYHVTIQFENGDIVITDSKGFYQNGVQSPTYKKQQYQYRVGETICNNKGQMMSIIAYNSSDDITVQFATGEIRQHVTYAAFRNGSVSPIPVHTNYTEKDALHQTRIAKNGQRMTVTGFRRSYDIDITFEDGTVVHGVRYTDFLRGHVRNPSIEPPTTAMIKAEIQKQQRMNQKYVTNEGDVVTIVYYAHSACMTVRWEDGTEKDGVKYRDLIAGNVRKPKITEV